MYRRPLQHTVQRRRRRQPQCGENDHIERVKGRSDQIDLSDLNPALAALPPTFSWPGWWIWCRFWVRVRVGNNGRHSLRYNATRRLEVGCGSCASNRPWKPIFRSRPLPQTREARIEPIPYVCPPIVRHLRDGEWHSYSTVPR